jgi:hypothetical protein
MEIVDSCCNMHMRGYMIGNAGVLLGTLYWGMYIGIYLLTLKAFC